MNKQYLLTGLLLVAAVSGCAVGPDYQVPETTSPSSWAGIKDVDNTTRPTGLTTEPALSAWWKSLQDPMLDSLLARAVESNLDLRVATARVREARASRGSVASDLWPQFDMSGSYSFRGSSLNTGSESASTPGLGSQAGSAVIQSANQSLASGQGITAAGLAQDAIKQVASSVINNTLNENGTSVSRNQNLFRAGFDASWEIDVFGGIRRSVEAADADLAAMAEDRRDVLITLLSEVALNYVELRGYQRRLAIARDNIQAQQDTLELTQERYNAGFTSELDVTQSRTQLAETRSQVPLLATGVRQAIFQISVLLGQPPATLLQELDSEGPIPSVPAEVPVGLPSDLLRRRPDIRTAERELAAATARVGVATADLFPRLSLTGSFGGENRDIANLLDNDSLFFSIGPAVSWPIFDGGRIRSNIEVRNAQQEQALALYEKTVLTAFQDVESSLVAYANEQVRYRTLLEAVTASEESTHLSNELYTRGMTLFLNVLESQRALYASQDALVQSQVGVITNLIGLYKSLGGGWSVDI